MMNPAEDVQGKYFGEPDQLEHVLQCVQLAHEAGADSETLMAALLLKIGHQLADGGKTGSPDHDTVGAWLETY